MIKIILIYLIINLCQCQSPKCNDNLGNDNLPAVPLVVKSPYLSTWRSARELFGSWTTFWNGQVKAMVGMIRVNGNTYQFMGGHNTRLSAKQIGLKVTPTQSIFTFIAGPIELTVNFFTPIDPTDLKRMSLPASYIAISARTTDNSTGSVKIYLDLTMEWLLSGDNNEESQWNFHRIGHNISNFDIFLKNQKPLEILHNTARWGKVKFFTDSNTSYEANECEVMRTAFLRTGQIRDTNIDNTFRAIHDRWPGVAFVREISVSQEKSDTFFYGIAHLRRPAITLAETADSDREINQLWESYFDANDNQMVKFFFEDSVEALKRAQLLDSKILSDSERVGGQSYANVVSAALRQTFGGTELIGTQDKPWLMLSDGCQVVDQLFPHFPVHIYLNPSLLKYLLEPLLVHQENGLFPKNYSMHDLGDHYPRCVGHKDGNDLSMEVEESGNMLIMMSAYVRSTKDNEFAVKHYRIAKQWAQYLVEHSLYPGEALTSDVFLGKIKNSTNLAIKGIIGIGAMAQLADYAEQHIDQEYYRKTAQKYVKEWMRLAEDPSGLHVMFAYDQPNTWAMLYNLYADVLLDTKLVPQRVYKLQDEWYLQVINRYGLPLEKSHPQTKFDWTMFTAAASASPTLRQMLFNRTNQWLKESQSSGPFSDWANSITGDVIGFYNRPVIGGVFAPLTVNQELWAQKLEQDNCHHISNTMEHPDQQSPDKSTISLIIYTSIGVFVILALVLIGVIIRLKKRVRTTQRELQNVTNNVIQRYSKDSEQYSDVMNKYEPIVYNVDHNDYLQFDRVYDEVK